MGKVHTSSRYTVYPLSYYVLLYIVIVIPVIFAPIPLRVRSTLSRIFFIFRMAPSFSAHRFCPPGCPDARRGTLLARHADTGYAQLAYLRSPSNRATVTPKTVVA